MNLRSHGTLYYFNTIKGGSVEKIQNVHSRGLVFKNLKDIYEADCARPLYLPVKKENELHDRQIKYSGVVVAKRTKSEMGKQGHISDCSGNIDEIPSCFDDLSSGEITLKQLKERCKTKKRKMSEFVCASPKKELAEFLQDGDDYDLTTPLSSWNVKSSKNAKSIKKCANCAPMAIKVEVSPFCCTEFQSASFATDEQFNLSDHDSTKLLPNSDTILENDEVISLTGQSKTCVLNENFCSQMDDDFMPISVLSLLSGNTGGPSTQETGKRPSVSYVSELQKEAEIMQLQCRQNFSLVDNSVNDNRLVTSSQSGMQDIFGQGTGDQPSDGPFKNGTEIVHGSELCTLEDNASSSSNMFNISQYCSSMPEIFNNESGCLVSSVENDYSLWCSKTGGGIKLSVLKATKSNIYENLAHYFLRSLFCYYGSPWNSYPCSASESSLVTPENNSLMIDANRSLISSKFLTARNYLEPKFYLTCLEDSSYANKEKQSLLPVNTDAEISFSRDAFNQLSTPETNNQYEIVPWQPPKRFHSLRRVISPTSQEKLCLAISSRKLSDNIDDYKCKGKLFFGNQTEDSILSASSDTAGWKSYMTDESAVKVSLTKAIFGPKKILKKQKHNRGLPPKRCSSAKGHFEGLPKKGSPPKGRLTRSIPGLCTGSTSMEACRESVVTFSQRQMQDIESVAVKLMTGLNSIKDIIEKKYLDKAYRWTSMKNDANEVKLAIKNAARVEETTKKWLSLMSRDCNRFCKIMSELPRSTEDVATSKENIMHKKRKRISFADEAGGVLCHVKYFENCKNNTGVISYRNGDTCFLHN